MKKFTTSSLLLLLLSAFLAPTAVAQTSEETPDNRIEKYEQLTEPETDSLTPDEAMESDTEAMESEEDAENADYRAEEKLEESQAQEITPSDSSMYDVRRTEAFNLVSSAYRGQFEPQGINGYAVMVSNYESGELTAEDLINAAIEAGELSPSAMEDQSYVQAVESQLEALKSN